MRDKTKVFMKMRWMKGNVENILILFLVYCDLVDCFTLPLFCFPKKSRNS